MGILLNEVSGDRVELRPRHRVGRATDADLRLDDPHVSGDHAMLRWDAGGWIVQDLGSTNGVFVDGRRVERGGVVPLDPGAILGFGERAGWQFLEDYPPVADAVAEDGERRIARDDVIDLDGALVRVSPEHGWILEDTRGPRPVSDNLVVELGPRRWRLRLPVRVTRTARTHEPIRVATCTLRSEASQDREHVRLFLLGADSDHDLGEHVYGDLILRLGEHRQKEASEGAPAAEQGWVERAELLREHKIESETLSQWLHRFRQALARAGVQDPEHAIERRRGSLRLAILLVS